MSSDLRAEAIRRLEEAHKARSLAHEAFRGRPCLYTFGALLKQEESVAEAEAIRHRFAGDTVREKLCYVASTIYAETWYRLILCPEAGGLVATEPRSLNSGDADV